MTWHCTWECPLHVGSALSCWENPPLERGFWLHPQARVNRDLLASTPWSASEPPSCPPSLPRGPPGPAFPPKKPQSHLFWEHVSHPSADLGSLPPLQPDCHLHLHLRWADNPYVSGTVHTKDTAPGLIMGAGRRCYHCPRDAWLSRVEPAGHRPGSLGCLLGGGGQCLQEAQESRHSPRGEHVAHGGHETQAAVREDGWMAGWTDGRLEDGTGGGWVNGEMGGGKSGQVDGQLGQIAECAMGQRKDRCVRGWTGGRAIRVTADTY